jgi:hypothetical protein
VEDDDLTVLTGCVRATAILPPGTVESAEIAIALSLSQRLEEMCVLAVRGMVPYREVATDELHIAGLTLPRVQVHAFLVPAVLVAVLSATGTAEKKDTRVARWRRDAPLLLTAIRTVDVCPAVVNTAHLERRNG